MPLLKVRHALFIFTLIRWLFEKVAASHGKNLDKTAAAIRVLKTQQADLQKEFDAAESATLKLKEFFGE